MTSACGCWGSSFARPEWQCTLTASGKGRTVTVADDEQLQEGPAVCRATVRAASNFVTAWAWNSVSHTSPQDRGRELATTASPRICSTYVAPQPFGTWRRFSVSSQYDVEFKPFGVLVVQSELVAWRAMLAAGEAVSVVFVARLVSPGLDGAGTVNPIAPNHLQAGVHVVVRRDIDIPVE